MAIVPQMELLKHPIQDVKCDASPPSINSSIETPSQTELPAKQQNVLMELLYGLLHYREHRIEAQINAHQVENDSEMLKGGLLIICTKADIPVWSRLLKNISRVSSLIYSADTLAQRRKGGVNRLTRYDVVITTYESLKAKEVALPMSFFDQFNREMLTKTDPHDLIE